MERDNQKSVLGRELGGSSMRYLKLGQHGDDVRALQNKLKVFVPEVEVDGRFGPRTERAVRIAQRRLG